MCLGGLSFCKETQRELTYEKDDGNATEPDSQKTVEIVEIGMIK